MNEISWWGGFIYYFSFCCCIGLLGVLGHIIQRLWWRKHPPRPPRRRETLVACNLEKRTYLICDPAGEALLRGMGAPIEKLPYNLETLEQLRKEGFREVGGSR